MAGTAIDPPSVEITRLMDGAVIAQLIHVAAELGVADLMSERPAPVDELVARVDADPDALYRMLRTLASVGVFTEPAPRAFALTPTGRTLRADARDSVRELARIRGTREHWQTIAELRHSVRTGRSAFTHVYGTDWWSYLASHTAHAELFNRAMGDNTQQVHAAVVDACDLSGVRRIVDVGGGRGDLTAALLRRYPDMTAVLVDQPHAVAQAEDVLTGAGVRDRVRLVVGDFFDTVPDGGEVYLLSRILHDWDDRLAGRILANIAAVLPDGGKVVIADAILPDGDGSHGSKIMDMIMLALHEGKERTEAEFVALVEAAGLRHVESRPTDAPISLIIADGG